MSIHHYKGSVNTEFPPPLPSEVLARIFDITDLPVHVVMKVAIGNRTMVYDVFPKLTRLRIVRPKDLDQRTVEKMIGGSNHSRAHVKEVVIASLVSISSSVVQYSVETSKLSIPFLQLFPSLERLQIVPTLSRRYLRLNKHSSSSALMASQLTLRQKHLVMASPGSPQNAADIHHNWLKRLCWGIGSERISGELELEATGWFPVQCQRRVKPGPIRPHGDCSFCATVLSHLPIEFLMHRSTDLNLCYTEPETAIRTLPRLRGRENYVWEQLLHDDVIHASSPLPSNQKPMIRMFSGRTLCRMEVLLEEGFLPNVEKGSKLHKLILRRIEDCQSGWVLQDAKLVSDLYEACCLESYESETSAPLVAVTGDGSDVSSLDLSCLSPWEINEKGSG